MIKKNSLLVLKIPDRPSFQTRRNASKHTLPRRARSPLNEFQQNQHEKSSLVCVREQSPSGLALVPCALSMDVGIKSQVLTMLVL